MFHQANMRVHDVPVTTINGKSGQYSLLMAWTEVVATEMTRLYVYFDCLNASNANAEQYYLASQDSQAG
jgi:hypothetical protein